MAPFHSVHLPCSPHSSRAGSRAGSKGMASCQLRTAPFHRKLLMAHLTCRLRYRRRNKSMVTCRVDRRPTARFRPNRRRVRRRHRRACSRLLWAKRKRLRLRHSSTRHCRSRRRARANLCQSVASVSHLWHFQTLPRKRSLLPISQPLRPPRRRGRVRRHACLRHRLHLRESCRLAPVAAAHRHRRCAGRRWAGYHRLFPQGAVVRQRAVV